MRYFIANKSIGYVPIYLFALLAPLSVTLYSKPLVILFATLFFIYTLSTIQQYKKLKTLNIEKAFLFGYLFFILISSFSLFITIYKLSIPIFDTKLLNRTVTSLLIITIIVATTDWIQYQTNEKIILFIKISLFSTIIFAVFGIYQIFSFEFNLPFIATRAYVWGATPEITKELSYRITSIALEPSFYTPIIIESIIISYLLFRRSLFIFFLLVNVYLIYKTHSTSAYIHLTALFFLYIIFNNSIEKKYKVIIFFLLILSIIFMVSSSSSSMEYFVDKLYIELSGKSSRSHSYNAILSEIINLNPINLLFGNGVNTLSFFNELTKNSYNMPFSVSNNLYIDILWDSGIIGGGIFLLALSYIFIKLVSYRRNKYGFIALLLFLSFLITSLYRSEYTSTHFAWTISNIIFCYYLAKKSCEENKS